MMFGTGFSLLLALFLFTKPIVSTVNSTTLALVLFIIATLLIVAQAMITVFAWSPLQKLEQNLTPHLMETFRRDTPSKNVNIFLTLFFILTYGIVLDLIFFGFLEKQIMIVFWTVSLGVSIDLLHYYLRRVMQYLDPFRVIDFFKKSAKDCIQSTKEAELCDWIDTFSETAIKAIKRSSPSMANLAAENIQFIAKLYLEAAKLVGYHETQDAKKFGGPDHVSYMLFYIFQRFELLFDKALQEKIEPICSKIVTILGKICIYGAKYDVSLMSYPLFYIGKFTGKAQYERMQEVGNRATMTLVEISKVIVREIDLQYIGIREPFVTLVNTMQIIAKDSFKNDKSINIRLLMQPFSELRVLFQSEKMAGHQDTPSIVHKIDMVIGEFATLESVLNTMPPVSEIVKERPVEQPPAAST